MTSAFSWQNCLPLIFFILYSNQLYFSKKKTFNYHQNMAKMANFMLYICTIF